MVRSWSGWVLGLLGALILEALPAPAGAQAVMGTGGGAAQIVIFPSPNVGLPEPAINFVPGVPSGSFPHGVSYYGSDNALVADSNNSRADVPPVALAFRPARSPRPLR